MTVYLIGVRETFGVKDGAITVTAVYGEGRTENLSELLDGYIEYANGSSSAGNFAYSIKEDKDKLGSAVENNILTVPDDANAGNYELIIIAEEKQPLIRPMSVSYGTEPVELTVTVTISKADRAAPDVEIVTETTCSSITVTSPDNAGG